MTVNYNALFDCMLKSWFKQVQTERGGETGRAGLDSEKWRVL